MLLSLLLVLGIASPGLCEDAKDATPSNPSWCKEGYVCVPTSWMAERVARVWEIKAELSAERAKRSRFGWTLGCGVGVAGVVTEGWDTKAVPGGVCGAMFGVRLGH